MCWVNKALAPIVTLLLLLLVAPIFSSPLTNNRIYGGKVADPRQSPYMISLQCEIDTGYVHKCGGSIISKFFILSAAQCIIDVDQPHNCTVDTRGSHRLDGISLLITEFIVHEEYDASTLINDIALVRLRDRLRPIDKITIIPMGREFIGGGVQVTAFGYGKSEDHRDWRGFLRYVSLNTMANDDCRKAIPENITAPVHDSSNICANFNEPGRGICVKDFGGPLVYNNTLIGIASWAPEDCASGVPNSFTRISEYIDWIEKHVKEDSSESSESNENDS